MMVSSYTLITFLVLVLAGGIASIPIHIQRELNFGYSTSPS